MSVWNVRLNRRKKIVIVRKILYTWRQGIVGLWGLLFLGAERKGKQHVITGCTNEEFEQIHVSSRIELTIKESVTGWRVLPMKSRALKSRKETVEEIPSIPYFLWSCGVCRKRGFVGYSEGEDLIEVGIRICNNHLEAIPGCEKWDLRIFDHNGKEQKDFMQVMAFTKIE